MTTSQTGRTGFASSTGGLLAISHGENLVPSSTQNTAAFTVADPPYLSSQLKSAEWLHRYGLKSQQLTFDQILQQIGFKRVESFNGSGEKRIGGKYAGNILQEIQNDNGDRYALTCRPEKLREFRNRLVRLLNVLRKRLTFLTSGSRRLFGILGEPSVCLVCDCKTTDHRIFNQFQLAIANLIREQVSKIKRFNLIWVTNDAEIFQEQPVDVTTTTIDQAIHWINQRKAARNKISISATCEAILKAFTNTVHSIYLISEGTSSDAAREILRDNIVKTRLASRAPIPVHVASLFCQNNDTETFLRSIAESADGNYFSSRIRNEISDFRTTANVSDSIRMKFQSGTNASTANSKSPSDVSLMYKEINECQNIIDRLDKILGTMRDENGISSETTKSLDAFTMSNNKTVKPEPNVQRSLVIQASALFNHDENDMASVDWLKIYGVDAQKLDFYSVLQLAAIRHCDGVVALNPTSNDTNEKTNRAATNLKDTLISTKYCDQFAHVTWPDGSIRHVYVTPEIHQDYERRMKALLEKIKARLSWLKKGSRDVFGTILEKNIYILIDTSKSMQNHLNFVKDKLRLLIQDQLLTKERVNMASFNNTINPWRDRLTRINDLTIQSQLQPWIDGLYAEGSTNTLSALRFALADSETEGIYLLTDGRPDQNERYILSQVQYRQMIPIHTIAFNCQDQNANQFLFDLAKTTGGRFHAFNYGTGNNSSIDVPESEDTTYLKQEIMHGEKDLQHVADLRDECMNRTWSQDDIRGSYKALPVNDRPVSLQIESHTALELPPQTNDTISMPQRIARSKYSSTSKTNRKRKSKSASYITEQATMFTLDSNQLVLPEIQDTIGSPTITTNGKGSTVVVSSASIARTQEPYDRVMAYLKRNSLVSKRLTIFDVLQPASVPVKDPKHIEVIDRYVLAKVWDDILSLTYGSGANKFRLVNHYALGLESYQLKLRELIVEYHRFTGKFIWSCLNDEEKRKVGPKIYWISLPKDDQNKNAQEITRGENTNESHLEYFAWRKLTVEQQNKTPVYHEKTAEALKRALRDAECQSGLQGVARMDVEIKRAIKFLQIANDLRQFHKRAGNEPTQTPDQKPPATGKPLLIHLRIGLRILYPYDGDGYYYLGSVHKNQHNRWIIIFDMEIEQEIRGHAVIPFNSNTHLKLFLDDCVLVRLRRTMEEYWAPGLVLCLPSPSALPGNLYKIQVHDPYSRQIYAHREDMIRITFGIFQRSVLYLQHIHQTSITNGTIDILQPPPPPPSDALQKLLERLEKQIIDLSKSINEGFDQFQTEINEHRGVIRLLQEQPVRPSSGNANSQVKVIIVRPPSRSETTSLSTTATSSPRPLESGTRVFAVWFDDDGLVYEGTIRKSLASHSYKVERNDLPGVVSIISRDDIFLSDDRRPLKDITTRSFALVQYPDDIIRKCFHPSIIFGQHHNESTIKVRFYDCIDKTLEDDKLVIPITEAQFARYADFRIEKEKSLINQVIVGFNKKEKCFMLGTVEDRLPSGHEYKIEWFDNTSGEQKEEHLFGAFTRRDQHRVGGYVLAMDNDDNIYKRAKTISTDGAHLKVQFVDVDGHSSSGPVDVPATTTFAITKSYFEKIPTL